jgi:hypothetical protein
MDVSRAESGMAMCILHAPLWSTLSCPPVYICSKSGTSSSRIATQCVSAGAPGGELHLLVMKVLELTGDSSNSSSSSSISEGSHEAPTRRSFIRLEVPVYVGIDVRVLCERWMGGSLVIRSREGLREHRREHRTILSTTATRLRSQIRGESIHF